MSLRARIAAAAGLAVGLAVLAAAVGVYWRCARTAGGDRSRGCASARRRCAGPAGARTRLLYLPGSAPGWHSQRRVGSTGAVRRRVGLRAVPSPNGNVEVPAGQGTSPRIAVSAGDRAIAASGTGSALSDRTVKGTQLRVLTIGTGASGAVLIARPLGEMNKELSRILLLLVIVGVAGIALAGISARSLRASRSRRRALHQTHGGAHGQPRSVPAPGRRGPRRARAAGGQLQHDARRARALGAGAAPVDRRRRARVAHADRLARRTSRSSAKPSGYRRTSR